MNEIYFQCKVKHRKTNETGYQKIVTELFLVDAISYTEAEGRITEQAKQFVSGEFKVTNIRATNYAEVHPSDEGDYWFKSKVSLIAYDEETGKERKTNINLLVQANDAKHAYENTIKAMKNTMGEYSIPSISETKIIEFFPFKSEII